MLVVLSYAFPTLANPSSIQEKTKGMEKREGFLTFYLDHNSGRIFLEVSRFHFVFLYLDSFPFGNANGPDRGLLGDEHIVEFERNGPKVLLIEENSYVRTSSNDGDEQLALRQSFSSTILGRFSVEAEEGGAALIDATNFFLHAGNGNDLDDSRSYIDQEQSRNFPRNSEIETVITITGPNGSTTLHKHYSILELPDKGYLPREYDPRSGNLGFWYTDFATPLGETMAKGFARRFRIEKTDPGPGSSEVREPIRFYVDRGIPEPIRTAVLEGARWWSTAFQYAGFSNAFQVELLPQDVDPMDIRYNVIQWVDRTRRDYSYARSIVDPRTGEIIVGRVTLGSLRAEQDYLIGEALLSPYGGTKTSSKEILEMVLARIRQLAAHEVGHVLGLGHNFAASSEGQGISVMDYPHPWIALSDNGDISLTHAYNEGIGEWDKVAIAYTYSEFQPGSDEKTELKTIMENAHRKGLYFMTDPDESGGTQPFVNRWDNGSDPVAELQRILKVRKRALSQFSENAIRPDVPLAQLQQTLVPLFLLHRYQTAAATKMIGGLNYRYALRGDGQIVAQIIPGQDQARALAAVLQTLDPSTLTIPESVLSKLPPFPPVPLRQEELFSSYTGLTFDPIAAAQASANLTLDSLLNPERASRLVEYHALHESVPSLESVIRTTLETVWSFDAKTGLEREVKGVVAMAAVEHVIALACNADTSPSVRAAAYSEIEKFKPRLRTAQVNAVIPTKYTTAATWRIERMERETSEQKPPQPAKAPQGDPLG
jgi:hypothetical protein